MRTRFRTAAIIILGITRNYVGVTLTHALQNSMFIFIT